MPHESRPSDPIRRDLILRIAALGGAGAGLAATGCANPAAVPAPPGVEILTPPAPRIGDRWRYARLNSYNGAPVGQAAVVVTAVTPQIRLSIDRGDGRPPVEEVHANPWSVLVETLYGDPITFDVPMPILPAGARPSLSLNTSGSYRTAQSPRPLRWSQRLRVVGWERIQVPAGSFDALRIERLISFTHPDSFRYDPTRTDQAWYSPQVGHFIAREWSGEYADGGPTSRMGRTREGWERWVLAEWKQAGG